MSDIKKKYTDALERLSSLHKEITGETPSIQSETVSGRKKLAKIIFPNAEGTNENYKLHSCFQIDGVWFVIDPTETLDNLGLENMILKKKVEEKETQSNDQ